MLRPVLFPRLPVRDSLFQSACCSSFQGVAGDTGGGGARAGGPAACPNLPVHRACVAAGTAQAGAKGDGTYVFRWTGRDWEVVSAVAGYFTCRIVWGRGI